MIETEIAPTPTHTTFAPQAGTLQRLIPAEPREQARRLLHVGFVVAPTVAGIDKFFDRLTRWEKYLAPQVAKRIPATAFMRAVGVVELAAGALVAVKPRVGAYVVAGWLGGIVGNLLLGRRHDDIALRDVGLLLGALALGRLSEPPRPSPS